MKKFTFTVDVVGDADVAEILSNIKSAVKPHGTYNCVNHDETVELSDQGLKVWAKRKIGLSLATPKAPKAPKQTEVAAS